MHVTVFAFTRNKMQKCYVPFLHNWCVESYQLLCKNEKSGVLNRKKLTKKAIYQESNVRIPDIPPFLVVL